MDMSEETREIVRNKTLREVAQWVHIPVPRPHRANRLMKTLPGLYVRGVVLKRECPGKHALQIVGVVVVDSCSIKLRQNSKCRRGSL